METDDNDVPVESINFIEGTAACTKCGVEVFWDDLEPALCVDCLYAEIKATRKMVKEVLPLVNHLRSCRGPNYECQHAYAQKIYEALAAFDATEKGGGSE